MKKWSNILTFILIVSFVLGQLFSTPYLVIIYTTLTAVVMLIAVIYSKGLSRIFGVMMLLIGCTILFYQGESIEVWMEGITKNLALVCLIILVPILSIPITLGNYHGKLAEFASRFNKKAHLYLFISGLFTVIGPITNIGAVHIIDSMLQKLKLPSHFLSRVYVRGFTSVHTWAPYFASVFLVVYSLKIPIYQFLPYGFVLSGFQIITAYLLFTLVEARNIHIEPVKSVALKNPKKLYELFAVILLLTGFIFLLEPFVTINASVLIALIVITFAILWSFYLNKSKEFFKKANLFLKSMMPDRANEVSLLLTAGFFGVVLSKTVISDYINYWWGEIAGISVLLLIFMTIILVSLLAFLGVHQIVTISAIIATVSFEQLGINVITMAMMLLSSWAVATTISPISPVNIVIAGTVKENIFKVIRWNLLYAGLITIVHTVVIYFVHLLLT